MAHLCLKKRVIERKFSVKIFISLRICRIAVYYFMIASTSFTSRMSKCEMCLYNYMNNYKFIIIINSKSFSVDMFTDTKHFQLINHTCTYD